MGMAKLTKQDVLHVANLANLKLTEEEISIFFSQLSSVVEFVSQLNEVDTEGIEPTSQTTGLENVLREDSPDSEICFSQDAALSGTDSVYNGLFKVKAILSERSTK